MRFRFGTEGADASRCLVVDGTADGFRTLSHWPGHRTPASLRHDLSTGIALNWARRSPAERRELLGTVDEVANNHYDTDGVLSVFAVMRPYDALARSSELLAAAATGDFATWHGEEALAVELTVMALPDHPQSPLARDLPADATDAQRWEAAYRWSHQHLVTVLDDPWRFCQLWAHSHQQVCDDVAAVAAGVGVSVEHLAERDLAVVTSHDQLRAIALHHAAGRHYRVLSVRPSPEGARYRFCFRDESWFDTVTMRAEPRVALDGVVAELQRREQAAGGSARWWCDELTRPVVQLGHCDLAQARAAGFFLDPLEDPGPPSRLEPDEVRDLLIVALAEG